MLILSIAVNFWSDRLLWFTPLFPSFKILLCPFLSLYVFSLFYTPEMIVTVKWDAYTCSVITFHWWCWFDGHLFFSCGEFGHLKKDCPEEDDITCYRCNLTGHKAQDCQNESADVMAAAWLHGVDCWSVHMCLCQCVCVSGLSGFELKCFAMFLLRIHSSSNWSSDDFIGLIVVLLFLCVDVVDVILRCSHRLFHVVGLCILFHFIQALMTKNRNCCVYQIFVCFFCFFGICIVEFNIAIINGLRNLCLLYNLSLFSFNHSNGRVIG